MGVANVIMHLGQWLLTHVCLNICQALKHVLHCELPGPNNWLIYIPEIMPYLGLFMKYVIWTNGKVRSFPYLASPDTMWCNTINCAKLHDDLWISEFNARRPLMPQLLCRLKTRIGVATDIKMSWSWFDADFDPYFNYPYHYQSNHNNHYWSSLVVVPAASTPINSKSIIFTNTFQYGANASRDTI